VYQFSAPGCFLFDTANKSGPRSAEIAARPINQLEAGESHDAICDSENLHQTQLLVAFRIQPLGRHDAEIVAQFL
jgi:hypothetical protein